LLSEGDIEAAHPDAFDFVWGNLPSAKRAEFNRHLSSCRYCQAVVDEYSEIGRIIKLLPAHVEPSADLDDRIVSAMTAAMAEQRAEPDPQGDAEDRAATRVNQIPRRLPSAEAVTEVHPRPAEVPIDLPADRRRLFSSITTKVSYDKPSGARRR
jgi:anti-sigma factor RsiW